MRLGMHSRVNSQEPTVKYSAVGQSVSSIASLRFSSKTPSSVTSFELPRPKPWLMRLMSPLNQWLFLSGLPVLRSIKGIKAIPGLGGVMDVTTLDIPAADLQRLKKAINPKTAAFIGPNHPEFMTDWVMDKVVLDPMAPKLACWASHEVISSAGSWMKRFWLSHNVIGNNGGEKARRYSIDWAKQGNAVLLHPEGTVHWTGDYVHRLFPGIAEMATQAAVELREKGDKRKVYTVPIVWKMQFKSDVSPALHREIQLIEKALKLPGGESKGKLPPLGERFAKLQWHILMQQVEKYGSSLDRTSEMALTLGEWQPVHFFDRQQDLQALLLAELTAKYPVKTDGEPDQIAHRLTQAIQTRLAEVKKAPSSSEQQETLSVLKRDRDKAAEIKRLSGFTRSVYNTPTWTQEQIAECLKRIRRDLVKQGKWNQWHNLMPSPVGPRVARIRVAEPIDVSEALEQAGGQVNPIFVDQLLQTHRGRLQGALDKINQEFASQMQALAVKNPWFKPVKQS
ncbi:MAG: hypothetical protein K2X01_01625 [Cyanobacteria bacterium]|nr:hypothetical protein [Cyanobacteriota bacterium]